MTKLKAAHADWIKDVTRCVAANLSVQLDALRQKVAVFKEVYKEFQAKVRRENAATAHDREEALRQHRLVLDQDQQQVRRLHQKF